jgi:pilus assembly protein CpaB
VTVDVDTFQAQKLALAQRVGSLSLTLRGIGEVTDGKLEPVTTDVLSDFVKEEDPVAKVRVRRAGSLSSVDVPPPDENAAAKPAPEAEDKPADEAGFNN